mgnify:CR=1 FL=1
MTSDENEIYLACANGFQGLYILNVEVFLNPFLYAIVFSEKLET